jgi:hypothetical protein
MSNRNNRLVAKTRAIEVAEVLCKHFSQDKTVPLCRAMQELTGATLRECGRWILIGRALERHHACSAFPDHRLVVGRTRNGKSAVALRSPGLPLAGDDIPF